MALGYVTATDIANLLLPLHTRGKVTSQTMEDKPLLKWLVGGQKTFTGGSGTLTDPVQGAYMSDNAGFLQGYSGDDQLNFAQAMNALRTSATWKEVHAGLIITWTELKQDGITITDGQKETEHSETELVRLTELLQNRMDDFNESYARAKNRMYWQDGSQDPKAPAGIKSILTDTPGVGSTLGLSRVTYPWWNHRYNVALAVSAENQTLCRFLQAEMRQLRKFGGKPDKALCGSDFLTALETEVYAKGTLTQEGFKNDGKTQFGMADISLRGLGKFEWDPTLDDMGEGKRCYIMDSRRLTLRPMQDEDNKITTPERPYNYMVFLRDITWTGVVTATQLNAHGIYGIA